ncbi:DUF6377 domain-containing protein [Prevotella sp.]|uniref:DUF6377 domain-containing protein n=1 Tax=Prevotella sp. TaxID=59823 RepID=UPI002E7A3636|nr:DUF6377 domain-containing protein [Prevotella sp.]MEE0668918.1 DUF6377 domain-containing protein [Prevotella sp.]
MKPSKPNNITLTHILRPRIAVMIILLWFGMSTAVSAVHPTAASIDSILQCIDKAISVSDQYVQKKKERIAYLKSRADQAETLSAKYELTYQLYTEYLPFVNDSAIYYLERCSDIALQMGDDSKAGGCLSLTALCCSNAGMYVESEAILKTINPEKLHGIDLGLYYYASGHISSELAYYGKFENMRRQYAETSTNYFLLAQNYLPAGHKYHNQCREMLAQGRKDFRQALAISNEWLHNVKPGSAEYALISYYRYFDYKALGDSIQMMYSLGESVLADIRNAVMDQGSMWEMANLLMANGDVDRSYRYICFTSDCADRFGSRQRLSYISPLLSRIAQVYKAKEERSNRSLRYTITAISILSLLLLIALVYVHRKRNQLAITRDHLALSNNQLQDTNAQLSSLNNQLSSLNSQLTTLNSQLSEANRVKDEYVGRFLSLCSIYIDKLEDIRKKVIKRVKNRQYAELVELTRSVEFSNKESNELYANFDTAFLQLFPTFVDDFNALLKPQNRITQPDNNTLNTPIRIFALIRLGISDSSKIAEFLHYSVNTIYNYRANIKNGAVGDRTEFEDKVKKIGMP